MKSLILSILASLTCLASARLGETPQQLVARYGEITSGKETPELRFQKNGIYVTVTLWNGVCHEIVFSSNPPHESAFGSGFVLPGDEPAPEPPKKQETPVASGPLTKVQIEQLLAANGGGAKWIERETNSWNTVDGKFFAYFVAAAGLHIKTSEFLFHKAEEEKKLDSKKTEGF